MSSSAAPLKFFVKDEGSTNGTRIHGKIVDADDGYVEVTAEGGKALVKLGKTEVSLDGYIRFQ